MPGRRCSRSPSCRGPSRRRRAGRSGAVGVPDPGERCRPIIRACPPSARARCSHRRRGPGRLGQVGALDQLARWLERKGRRVSTVPWIASPLVHAAAASSRTRIALTPTVAALLGAADDAVRAADEVRPRLSGGRGRAARPVRLECCGSRGGPGPRCCLGRRAPRPTPGSRPGAPVPPGPRAGGDPRARRQADLGETAAVATAFGAFAERLCVAYDRLAATSGEAEALPWPVAVVVLDARLGWEPVERLVREAFRPLLSGERHVPGLLLSAGAAA